MTEGEAVHNSPEIAAKCPICRGVKADFDAAKAQQLAEDAQRRKDIETLRALEVKADKFREWHDKIFGGYEKRHGK